jgi:tryptophan synthase beta chain
LHGSRSLVINCRRTGGGTAHILRTDYPHRTLHAHLFTSGRASFHSATDQEALEAAFLLARLEGIIPALETAHALAILEKIPFRKEDHIVICLSGRGDKDLDTYMKAQSLKL